MSARNIRSFGLDIQSSFLAVCLSLLAGICLTCSEKPSQSKTVDHPPHLAALSPLSIGIGDTLAITLPVTDQDGDTVAVTCVNPPQHSALTCTEAACSFTFWPDSTQIGLHLITFIASDGALSDTEQVAITVSRGAANHRPVLESILPQRVVVGSHLIFPVVATDSDGISPIIMARNLPSNASLIYAGDTSFLSFYPDISQAGEYLITLLASDGFLADTEFVSISVLPYSSHRPVLEPMGPFQIQAGSLLSFQVVATDPDGTTPAITAGDLPRNATLNTVDRHTTFSFQPGLDQLGDHYIYFVASDGVLQDYLTVRITVTPPEADHRPIFNPIGPVTVFAGSHLEFEISAVDIDGTEPVISAVNVPLHGRLVKSYTTTSFMFDPTVSQVGVYEVTFIATDGYLADSLQVAISVELRPNRAPVIQTIGPKSLAAGTVMSFQIAATDSDGTIPMLSVSDLPRGASFTINGDSGIFNFSPDDDQIGSYQILLIASDGILADSEIVKIQVLSSSTAFIPCAIGNYWVYQISLREVHCLPAIIPYDTCPHSETMTTDSITIVDSLTENNLLWWIFDKPMWPIGDKFAIRNDSLFSQYGLEFFTPAESTTTYPMNWNNPYWRFSTSTFRIRLAHSTPGYFEFYAHSDPSLEQWTMSVRVVPSTGIISGSQAYHGSPHYPRSSVLERTLITFHVAGL